MSESVTGNENSATRQQETKSGQTLMGKISMMMQKPLLSNLEKAKADQQTEFENRIIRILATNLKIDVESLKA